jgi:hypothetical protein
MKTIKGKFCQSNTPIQETYDWDEDNPNKIYRATCQSCNTEHEISEDGSVNSFYLTSGDLFLLFNEDKTFTLSQVDDNYNENIILKLSYWPENITPDNLSNKIRLFLTYS